MFSYLTILFLFKSTVLYTYPAKLLVTFSCGIFIFSISAFLMVNSSTSSSFLCAGSGVLPCKLINSMITAKWKRNSSHYSALVNANQTWLTRQLIYTHTLQYHKMTYWFINTYYALWSKQVILFLIDWHTSWWSNPHPKPDSVGRKSPLSLPS